MAMTQHERDQADKDAHKNHPETGPKNEQQHAVEPTGTKAVDAPDPMTEGKAPQVVVNPEYDSADNTVKLAERNVDQPTPEAQRDRDVRQGGEGGGKGGDDAKAPHDNEAARAEAKRQADASLQNAPASFGGLSGQIAAYLRARNVPVVKAEDDGKGKVKLWIEPIGGGQLAVYEAEGAQATPEAFLGQMRLAGYVP